MVNREPRVSVLGDPLLREVGEPEGVADVLCTREASLARGRKTFLWAVASFLGLGDCCRHRGEVRPPRGDSSSASGGATRAHSIRKTNTKGDRVEKRKLEQSMTYFTQPCVQGHIQYLFAFLDGTLPPFPWERDGGSQTGDGRGSGPSSPGPVCCLVYVLLPAGESASEGVESDTGEP